MTNIPIEDALCCLRLVANSSTSLAAEPAQSVLAELDRLYAQVMEHQGFHIYLSTACLHGNHGYCAAMVGQQGEKRSAQCKFCPAQCVCSCHKED